MEHAITALGLQPIAAAYEHKPNTYFVGARNDIVAMMGTDRNSAVLELGCSAGGTGRATLAAGKAGRYVGIELDPPTAAIAALSLSDVIVGNAEVMDLGQYHGQFDALILSEVLEHLTDPWGTLAKLVRCLKAGAEVYASSPNVAHWHVLRGIISGRFDYNDEGVMDRTHLRWFTPATFREMFEGAGVEVVSIGAVAPFNFKQRAINAMTGGKTKQFFTIQIMVCGRKR